jgi:hypothetical protein
VAVVLRAGDGQHVHHGRPVAVDVRAQERAIEGDHAQALRMGPQFALPQLHNLVLLHLSHNPAELIALHRVAQIVLVAQQIYHETRLLVHSSHGDALLGAQLFSEGSQRAADEGLGHEGVGESVAVVGEHENLLELIAGADGQFEDVLLGLRGDAREVADCVSDCDCGRVFVDAAHSVPLLHDVLHQLVHKTDQGILADSLTVHQQH